MALREFLKRADLWKRIARLERKVAGITEQMATVGARERELNSRARRQIEELQRQQRIETVMDWIGQATLKTRPLISVIMPTKNRAAFLPRAIASLEAQSYDNWELVVVDDGSTDATPEYLDGLRGERFRPFRAAGAGASAARNIALAKACGELIAYLDDDNIMHPEWLKSVVWAFEQRPESNVLYGAFVVQDSARIKPSGAGGEFPKLSFEPYDRETLLQRNIADMGCIAHRAHLAEGYFDEALSVVNDWDLFLRLTRDETPIALPAIALYYTVDAPNRLSGGPNTKADVARILEKARR